MSDATCALAAAHAELADCRGRMSDLEQAVATAAESSDALGAQLREARTAEASAAKQVGHGI